MTKSEFLTLEIGRVVQCRTRGADQGRLFEVIGIDREYGELILRTLDLNDINIQLIGVPRTNEKRCGYQHLKLVGYKLI